MRTLVVYESMWGNTEQVARAVAAGVEGRGPVEVRDVSEELPDDLRDVDLLVVGGPTHAFSMSRPSTRDVAVATFDTRVGKVRHLPGSAARKAAKEVRRHHVGRLVDVASFYVEDVAGPLLDGELDRALAWGTSLAAQSCQG